MARIRHWIDALRQDLPERVPVTESTREALKGHGRRYRGSVRLAMGSIYTDAEYEERRQHILATELP